MQPEKEVTQCYEQMNIVEKYETVIAYLYPIDLENCYGIHCHQHP